MTKDIENSNIESINIINKNIYRLKYMKDEERYGYMNVLADNIEMAIEAGRVDLRYDPEIVSIEMIEGIIIEV